MSDIVIFESGDHQVQVRLEGGSVWLSLGQLAELFERDKSDISRHLKNIFETKELDRRSVVAKNATTDNARDGPHRSSCPAGYGVSDRVTWV